MCTYVCMRARVHVDTNIWEKISLHYLGWSGTFYIAQGNFKLIVILLSWPSTDKENEYAPPHLLISKRIHSTLKSGHLFLVTQTMSAGKTMRKQNRLNFTKYDTMRPLGKLCYSLCTTWDSYQTLSFINRTLTAHSWRRKLHQSLASKSSIILSQVILKRLLNTWAPIQLPLIYKLL